ncbi:MAG: cysteine desulfurase NifS [Candidatus Omnitrophica bacterium]|nr:cysteine desulfurase NifS [Candidatus Omnitrophota bacterium]
MKRIYLDYNATTPQADEVTEAMLPYFRERYGNASSPHLFGREARGGLERARERVAALIGADTREIIFTSGATESNNALIKGIARKKRDAGRHIITTAVEHHSVLAPCKALEREGFEVTYLGVDSYGVIDLDQLRDALRDDTVLVTVMSANNETGTLQPIEEIATLVRERNSVFHTDAVQQAGKLPLDVKELHVDALSLSAHKFYGPKGVGALYVRRGVVIPPLLEGGHHERNLRAGTENIAGIVGMGRAAELARERMENDRVLVTSLRERLHREITQRISDVVVNGHPERRLPNTLNVSFRYVEGESVILSLDMKGIAVASGSACTSGSLEASHVLLAMGVPPEQAYSSVRFSLGRYTTAEEIDCLVKELPSIIERLRSISTFSR